MRTYAQHFLLVGLLMAFCVSFSGCLKAEITTGKQPGNDTVELGWAHGFVYGIVPPTNGPLNVGENQCENGIAKVSFKQTFIQGLAQSAASGVLGGFPWYNPQKLTVTCAAGGSMSSLEAPPSYLLRDAKIEASSQRLATAK